MVKKSQGMINKEKYLSDGHKIPTCVNKGCNNDVVVIKDRFFTYANDKIAKNYCNTKNKYFLRLSMNGLISNKPADYVRYY